MYTCMCIEMDIYVYIENIYIYIYKIYSENIYMQDVYMLGNLVTSSCMLLENQQQNKQKTKKASLALKRLLDTDDSM